MTGVILGQSMVLVFLLTVHGHVCPISGSGCHGEGPHGSPSCQRAPRVSQAKQKYAKGSSAPMLTLPGRARRKSFPIERRGRAL
jgi:hypothetical protein